MCVVLVWRNHLEHEAKRRDTLGARVPTQTLLLIIVPKLPLALPPAYEYE